MKSRPSVFAALALATVAVSACSSSTSPSAAKQSAHDAASSLAAKHTHGTQVGGTAAPAKTTHSSSTTPPISSASSSLPSPLAKTPQIGVPVAYTLGGATVTMRTSSST